MRRAEDRSALTADVSGFARSELLARLEGYYDTTPRATARTEQLGSLVLLITERGWPFYARPQLGPCRSDHQGDPVGAGSLEHGVTTIFCGAESSDVARVYERVGFRRIGTTCTAEID